MGCNCNENNQYQWDGILTPGEKYDPIRPRWILVAGAWSEEYCDYVIETADNIGWTHGSYANGEKRDNVSCCFFNENEHPQTAEIFWRMRSMGHSFGQSMRIDVKPEWMDSMQVSRWREGDHYGTHRDHDPNQNTHLADRKLSIYVSLSNGGGLTIGSDGLCRCNKGDALIMSGQMDHAAPVQESGERHSIVAWIPGPRWR